MSFLDLVKMRSSVRKYASRPVPREAIGRCLEAARLSPSACNAQPWQFIVVDDPGLKKKLADAAFAGVFSMNAFAKDAPVLVVVVRERSGAVASLGGLVRNVPYNLVDIGIACEHFILQAAEEGIGTCWLGWFNGRAVRKTLGIPRGKNADIMISMGYPADGQGRDKIRKSAQQIVRFN
ncbi:MAG: nitroreductase family protein [Candidatus Omnitrophica bacterium]|nr:nitroreductase family protein [Candidatus Omnitrophota bacterium]